MILLLAQAEAGTIAAREKRKVLLDSPTRPDQSMESRILEAKPRDAGVAAMASVFLFYEETLKYTNVWMKNMCVSAGYSILFN